MNSLKTVLFFCIALLISACDHPLEIKGEGDILSSTGQRNCSLEDFQAGEPNCSRNTVQGGAYVETYTAQPRSGWVFNRWENYCTTSAANVCSFAVPADLVQNSFGSTLPALVAVFSPETGGNPFFLGDAIPEYSATRVLKSSAGSFTMMEYATPLKQRIELTLQGLVTTMINRSDLNVTWLLYPSLKQYMEISGDQFDNQTGGDMDVIDYNKVGTEELYGFLSDKYQVTIKNSDGNNGTGFFWLTRVGILLQMEMTITTDDGKQEKILMFLRDLVVATQPAYLFEIPGDFSALPSLSIPGFPSR